MRASRFIRVFAVLVSTLLLGCSVFGQADDRSKVRAARGEQRRPSPRTQPSFAQDEAGILANHVQLTFADQFDRAGEAYFSPDGRRIIFQAVELPGLDETIEEHYQMYVADLVRNRDGVITGIDGLKRLSPPGSSSTCGWFHPTEPDRVIFGCTVVPPKEPKKAGYQREGRDYTWSFPPEMDIVSCDVTKADGSARTLERLVEDPDAYLAECVISSDARHLVYCERPRGEGNSAGDLKIMDLATRRVVTIADRSGYDGGPFFSPDGRRLCYRSDRRGNDLLQIFVAELAFDTDGRVTGLEREFQLTDNPHVNWAPFWHPNGRYLIYTTSQMGHENYEVFMLDADSGYGGAPSRFGTRKRRITHARGFDGLPVFDADGRLMMWTSQRGDGGSSQIWVADFLVEIDAAGGARVDAVEPREDNPTEMHVTDPDTGLIYIYDVSTHELSAYDPKTHKKRPVTEDAEKATARRLFNEKGD